MTDNDITGLLHQWSGGEERALEQLTPLVYEQLHQLACRHFRRESAGHTLQPTALVNEAYQMLVGVDIDWKDRNHFMALCSRMMRRVLVNHANTRNAAKRGGDAMHVTYIEELADGAPALEADVLALDAALDELEAFDERKARALELHYFAGMTYAEMAEILGVAESTVHADLRISKAWLFKRLQAA
ncbi:ECF-type sigma factor [Marinihelvus fidelis]|nr:ECF-type sigma factor [Marinihelvus fidelis]